MEFSLRLEFYGSTPELVLVSLKRRGADETISVRGKTPGALVGRGTFQWTSAVRAIATLFTKWALFRARNEQQSDAAFLIGDKGTIAASLDYAFYKNPAWIADMFGCDGSGTPLLRRFITRTNPGRKRPGPVIIGVNQRYVKQGEVLVLWNGEQVSCPDKLGLLVNALEASNASALTREETELKQIAA